MWFRILELLVFPIIWFLSWHESCTEEVKFTFLPMCLLPPHRHMKAPNPIKLMYQTTEVQS